MYQPKLADSQQQCDDVPPVPSKVQMRWKYTNYPDVSGDAACRQHASQRPPTTWPTPNTSTGTDQGLAMGLCCAYAFHMQAISAADAAALSVEPLASFARRVLLMPVLASRRVSSAMSMLRWRRTVALMRQPPVARPPTASASPGLGWEESLSLPEDPRGRQQNRAGSVYMAGIHEWACPAGHAA